MKCFTVATIIILASFVSCVSTPTPQSPVALATATPQVAIATATAMLSPTEMPTISPSPTRTNTPVPTDTATPTVTPTRQIPTTGQIWFAPFMYGQPAAPWQKGFGARDYLDLFTPDASWSIAASRVHIFKSYMYAFDLLSDAELRRIVTDLNRRDIAIALETQPLTRTGTCGNSEAFASNGPAQTLSRLRRFRAAGGQVRYLAMDEPLTFGRLPSPEGCGLSTEQVAQEVANYIIAVKREFPDVIIGDIEYEGAGVEDVKHFLEAYRNVTGAYLSFLHWDINWQQPISWWPVDWKQRRFLWPEWPEKARELEVYCRERGVRFGMIYNGNADASTDAEWLKQAEDHMAMYESLGGKPDHVIFQSWHKQPQYLLPETDPTKFTYLINRYFHTRTALNLKVSPSSSGEPREVTGKLIDARDAPIGAASVEILVKPTEGVGVVAEYSVTSLVPDGTKEAMVGFRVNTECSCAGDTEFRLYEVRYREGNDTAQRVPNGNFSQGLQAWNFLSPNTVQIRSSDVSASSMLQAKATARENATINSSKFPVTSGAIYTLTFVARVAPVSVGSGYFAIFFLSGSSEVSRNAIPIEPAFLTYNAVTDNNGEFRLISSGLPSSRFVIQGKYDGDSSHWPTYIRVAP